MPDYKAIKYSALSNSVDAANQAAQDADEARNNLETQDQQVQDAIAIIESLSMVNYSNDDVTTKPDLNASDGDISYWFDSSKGALRLVKFNASENEWENHGEPIPTLNPVHIAVNSRYKREALSSESGISLHSGRFSEPLVSFIDDDGTDAALTKLKPILDNKGITAGFAIATDNIGSSGYLTWSEVEGMASDGWEVLSHTKSHVRISDIDDNIAELNDEIGGSRDDIEAQGLEVYNFVNPYGDRGNKDARRLTRKYYRNSFRTADDVNYQPLDYFIRRVNFQTTEDPQPTLEELKAYVDEAKANDAWVVFSIHAGYSNFDDRSSVLEDLIDYIQSEGVEVVNPNEGINRVGNLIQVGDDLTEDYFKIDGKGEVYSPKIGRHFVIQDKNANTPSDSIDEYPEGETTVSEIQSSFASSNPGFPDDGAGLLVTFRNDDAWARQWYYPYRSADNSYMRYWHSNNEEWSDWVKTKFEIDIPRADGNADPSNIDRVFGLTDYSNSAASTYSMPEERAGTLVTYNLGDTYAFQEYKPYLRDYKYRRHWQVNNSEWTDWIRTDNLNTIPREDGNDDPSTIPVNFALTDYSNSAATDHSMPEDSAGVLITYNVDPAYAFQDYKLYQSNTKYRRYWGGSAWSSWEQVDGGATGSFTASSGETVTVENGLITDIS